MEVGRKRGISRKMQAKDPKTRLRKACRATLPSFPAICSNVTAFARCSSSKQQSTSSSIVTVTDARPVEGSMLDCRGIMRAITSSRLPRPNYPSTIHQAAPPLLLPSNRPSVTVHFAPLLRRLLEIHTIIIKHPLHPPSIPLQPAKYRKHVRQGRRSYSLQPAPCLYPTAGASTECAFDIARCPGCRGATE